MVAKRPWKRAIPDISGQQCVKQVCDGMDGTGQVNNEVWARNEVQSPCVKLCVVHPEERLCVGCFRTIDEIAAWSRLTPAERAAILADLPNRAPRLRQRRGGRMARLDR
jgi:uncharacterized protein